ncbi:MAG: FecR family protein [Pollutimonas bauzanensis]|uniref:FecR family protein n=1 Tax=Pollutimonas bauzanensis TaxID=658167 RepID=A0A1M5Y8J4_9BURK|nr:FecR domain-containing protein [Pollutimonas bauzanensis]SHI08292.1 FecR family protein [Pollutimonas bauzanensis]
MSRLQEEAARWFVRMSGAEPDDPERGRFEAWLAASPAHAAAYAAIADTWSDLESGTQCNALAQAMQARQERHRQSRRTLLRRGILGIVLGGLGGEAAYYRLQNETLWESARRTDTGTLGREFLQDGSILVLDADSEVLVVLSRSERRVKLLTGEVIFDVAKDPERPFVVDSGPAQITVLGTRFAVTRLRETIRVSVDHGLVQIAAGPFWRRQYLQLEAGQVAELRLATSENIALKKVDRKADAAFSFEHGILMFDRADLGEVAETLSRYRKTPVRVAARGTGAGPRITAGVPAAQIESFIDLLPQIASVSVRRRGDEVELGAR